MGRRITTEQKAETLLLHDKVFKAGETDKNIYFVCAASNGNAYNIIYNKRLLTFACECKNIRSIDCSHIIAARKLNNEKNHL